MLGKRLLLLALLLVLGVAVVWIFGVDEGESLMSGGRRPSSRNDEPVVEAAERAPNATDSAKNAESQEVSDSLAVGNARIPVREALPDNPEIRVLKYLILIASSDGAVGRRVRAKNVRIEVFNKKPDPESKRVAIITGGNAEIVFRDPPDPKTGFRDSQLVSMSLTSGNRIEHLDEAEKPIAVLENDDLHLTDDEITGKGPCKIEMQGLLITGTDLRYDRVGGGLELKKDVVIRGKGFALPSQEVAAGSVEASEANSADEDSEKSIACNGPFTFQPRKADENTPAGTEMSSLLSEGTMSFHGSVVATQGDRSRLECEDLEIVLDKAAPAQTEVAASKDSEGPKIGVSRMFARGSNSKPCVLTDTMGKFIAETILQEEKPEGSWVTLNGSPRVEDACLAADDEATGGESKGPSFDASATHQIRLRPVAPPVPADPTAPAIRRFLVEIDGKAELSADGLSGNETVKLNAELIEMHLATAAAPKTGEEAAAADASSAASSATSSKGPAGLERLLARGDATGALSKGVFKGDRIELLPAPSTAGESQFRLSIEPNPDVRFAMSAGDEQTPPQSARFVTPIGNFVWTPGTPEKPASAVFTGPTTVFLFEGDVTTTTLNAVESIELKMAEREGKQEISSLVAKGEVAFEDTKQGVSGNGREMTLEPRDGQKGRMKLLGSPANAVIRNADGTEQHVAASTISVDPEDGSLQADDSVVLRLAGFGLVANDPTAKAAPKKDTPPARLMCQSLDVRRDELGRNVVKATRDVIIEDEANAVSARADALDYIENDSRIFLRGSTATPASMTRMLGADPGATPNFVTITGPELMIDSETANLTCEREGRIEMVQPLAAGEASSTVRARSTGPIRYGSGILDLSTDVIIQFEENGVETRSLWCDRAKVFFKDEAKDGATGTTPEVTATDAQESAAGPAGFEELLAEGRVHLVQSKPRDMEAEGHQLRWRVVDGRETLYLKGSSPRCWIRGLSENSHLRYEADSFVVITGSQDFTAENGRLIYEPESLPK
jgi:hypothetical protein